MDINEFLQLCLGQWFSQRSSYHFRQQQSTSDQSELTIEWLSLDAPELTQLCQSNQIDPQKSLGGQKISWDNSSDWGKNKQLGSRITIFIPNNSDSSQGQLLSNAYSTLGLYELGKDQSLSLILEDSNESIQERIWFASPNLRLRTSLIKNEQGFTCTAFYSEIRKLSK